MRGPEASPVVRAALPCCSPRRPADPACRPQSAAACRHRLDLPGRLPKEKQEPGIAVAWATPVQRMEAPPPSGRQLGRASLPGGLDAGREKVALIVELGEIRAVVCERVTHDDS